MLECKGAYNLTKKERQNICSHYIFGCNFSKEWVMCMIVDSQNIQNINYYIVCPSPKGGCF